MPVTVEHDIADYQDRGLIETRHGQLHGATHIQNEQGRDINTGKSAVRLNLKGRAPRTIRGAGQPCGKIRYCP